jgi:light-regulated signal transduction histidine kinase (bacteriophytochrome)
MQNLLSNAWKYSAKCSESEIEVRSFSQTEEEKVFYVRDNGVGFDITQAKTLFAPFQRMHSQKDFPGTGIGLTSVQRIISKHRGKVWIDSVLGETTSVYFSLPNG